MTEELKKKTSTPGNIVHKDLSVSGLKVVDAEKGIVEAFVSGIGNKDSVGDIIQPGAFDEYLQVRTPKGVWSHDWEKPISKTLEIYEVPAGDTRLPIKMQTAGIGGLYVKTQFNLDTQLGRDSFSNVKFFGDEAEWSIGYQVHEQEWDGKAKAQLLHTIELYEYSPVLFGANPLTSTVSLKAHKTADGTFEYEVQGLDDLTQKAVTAALDIILEEKKFSVEEVDETDSADVADDTETKDSEMAEKKTDKPVDGALKAIIGSYEERYEKIAKALREWADDIGYAYVYATFESKIIFYLYDYKSDNSGYFQVSYELADDDEVTFGEAIEVDVVEVVTVKSAIEEAIKAGKTDAILDMLDGVDGGDAIATKAGRVLSAKNRSALSDALDAIKAVLEADEAEEKEVELTPQEKAALVLKSLEDGEVPSAEDLALLKSVVTPEVEPEAEKDDELDPDVDWDAVNEYVKAVAIEAEISEWSEEDLESVKAWAEAVEAKDAEDAAVADLDPEVDWEAVSEYVKAVAEAADDDPEVEVEVEVDASKDDDESEADDDDEEEGDEVDEKSEKDEESGEKVALDVSYIDMLNEIDELEEFSAQIDD